MADAADHAALELVRRPFRDAGVPASLDVADEIVSTTLDAARASKNVVVHCRGGLGRTGLVVACCLVKLGFAAGQAIATVRASREGAIETREQESFVRRYAESHRGASSNAPPPRGAAAPGRDRVLGCLLGGALGDALGYPVKLDTSAEAIFAKHGHRAPRNLLGLTGGVAHVSDDTQMTLFVAEGVIRGIQRWRDRGICSMPGSIQRALVRWYATQTRTPLRHAWGDWPGWLVGVRQLHARRAPGNTCMSALALQVDLPGEPTVASPPNDSKGCGAVVRSASIGLAAGSREAAFALARDAVS